MARPSQKTDRQLIETAEEMFKTSGLSRVNLRQVAAKAGVNLGMFHYHFKTKDQFIRAVLQDTYEKFFMHFTLQLEEDLPPLEKLRKALFLVGRFLRENRRLLVSLLQDALNRHPVALQFARDNFKRHGLVLLGLLKRCQKEGSLDKVHPIRAMVFLMASIGAPNLAVTAFQQAEASKWVKIPLKGLEYILLSDAAIRQRVDMALKGLGAKERGPK